VQTIISPISFGAASYPPEGFSEAVQKSGSFTVLFEVFKEPSFKGKRGFYINPKGVAILHVFITH
jgi:hypothetical protein